MPTEGVEGRRTVLALAGIVKRFGALRANDAIDLTLAAGEIVALLGENGAGKTTLMNILFGHISADAGTVRVAAPDGRLVTLPPGSPRAALASGIGMVHQHFTLAHNLNGFENIVLGTTPSWRLGLRGGQAAARHKVERLMAETGLCVALDRPVVRLSVGERQRIEILKALYRDTRVLILDEPTAVLNPQEIETLFTALRRLAARGLAILFISHKLPEVLALSERIVVLRGGRKVGEMTTRAADERSIADLMVGRDLLKPRRPAHAPGAPVLTLHAAALAATAEHPALHPVDLTVRAGEVVGVAGVAGNGQAALAALLTGMAAPSSGTLRLNGAVIRRHTPRAFIALGVARIPEDRHHDGVVGAMSVQENLVIEDTGRYQRGGFLRLGAMRAHAARLIEAHDIRCAGPDVPVHTLSGGNMQKLILARNLARAPLLVLANQPTRGLDVGAQADMHRRLLDLRQHGGAIVLISEDLDEVFALSDRIVVAHAGHLTEAGAAAHLGRGTVGLMMAGQPVERTAA